MKERLSQALASERRDMANDSEPGAKISPSGASTDKLIAKMRRPSEARAQRGVGVREINYSRERSELGMREIMERVKGIEPSSLAWKAIALPLSYTRIFVGPSDAHKASGLF